MNKIIVAIAATMLVTVTYADNTAFNTVDHSIKLIKQFEGFHSEVYTCQAGKLSIGYGFTEKELIAKRTITRAEADEILKCRVVAEIEWVRKTFPKLDAQQQVAIVSLAYNIGHSKLLWKTVDGKRVHTNAYTALQKGDWNRAAKEIREFRMAGGVVSAGLVRRREAEMKYLLH